MRDKVDTLIGFAIKARKVVWGTDNIIKSRNNKLIICCTNLAENSKSKLINAAKNDVTGKKIPVILSQMPLEDIVYKQGVKAIAVTDKQMSEAILKNLTSRFTLVGEERSV